MKKEETVFSPGVALMIWSAGTQIVAGGVSGAGHVAVHLAFFEQQGAEVKVVFDELARLVLSEALFLAVLVELLRERAGDPLVERRKDFALGNVRTPFLGVGTNLVRHSHEDHTADLFLRQPGCGLKGPFVFGFRQNDFLVQLLGADQ